MENDEDDLEANVMFGSIDLHGVCFDDVEAKESAAERKDKWNLDLLRWEKRTAFSSLYHSDEPCCLEEPNATRVSELCKLLYRGDYLSMIRSSLTAQEFFRFNDATNSSISLKSTNDIVDQVPRSSAEDIFTIIEQRIIDYVVSPSKILDSDESIVERAFQIELLGIAALNLFMQCNYTGPSLRQERESYHSTISEAQHNDVNMIIRPLEPYSHISEVNPHAIFRDVLMCEVNPHAIFRDVLMFAHDHDKQSTNHCDDNNAAIETQQAKGKAEDTALHASQAHVHYQNNVLANLAVDGHWPCQVCDVPYFLLLARGIFSTLVAQQTDANVTALFSVESSVPSSSSISSSHKIDPDFLDAVRHLKSVHLWHARALVAHNRLLQSPEPSLTLWHQVDIAFTRCVDIFCNLPNVPKDIECDRPTTDGSKSESAIVLLEYGLAEHHFDRAGTGLSKFRRAQQLSGLKVTVTGAMGKRTKFQQNAVAQFVVQVESKQSLDVAEGMEKKHDNKRITEQMIEHPSDGILLERVQYNDDKENAVVTLGVLDQAILLALCLDVKNKNPVDGLTAEEMGAYLSKVLDNHDDWMIYSTGLLERAWLEYERSHARERAILQLQALVDQHTQRLTLTQSTRESVSESAPAHVRLKNIHEIVYPPRWQMIGDLARRYSSLGIVTSAAELYKDIEAWDDVVDCYRRAGRVARAEQIVRDRLAIAETPRMWVALGALKKDPMCYERALTLSRGRYFQASVELGHFYFDRKEYPLAAENYENSLRLRPLSSSVWFRLGVVCMQLERWNTALQSFSEVVQQDPENGDAWANVAAVHMHNKHPLEAYPALIESLKHSRENWRVWLSKLYVSLDLQKYDEAIQACNVILDLKTRQQADSIPELEERCVRAIVGGAIKNHSENEGETSMQQDSTRRTLIRVDMLLDRIRTSSNRTQPWLLDVISFFYTQFGDDSKVLDNLMEEFRAIQLISGWERDDNQIRKLVMIALQISRLHQRKGDRESLIKARFLLRGIIRKVELLQVKDTAVGDVVQTAVDVLEKIEAAL
jgi:tetratricopeptide (TPR) repeat protein